MELTGRPPVPPRKAFGLWVSEFGYDNWDEIDGLKAGLRGAGFPLDGFVLDLNWFGGIVLERPRRERDGPARLGPGPGAAADRQSLLLPRSGRPDRRATPRTASGWWRSRSPTSPTPPRPSPRCRRSSPPTAAPTGAATRATRTPGDRRAAASGAIGRMIDWTDPDAGAWIHAERRFPNLAELGITGHWTDLGEPETLRSGRLLRRRRDDGGRAQERARRRPQPLQPACGTRRSGTATSPAPASRTVSASPTRGRSS